MIDLYQMLLNHHLKFRNLHSQCDLTITFGMKNDDKIEWKNDTAIEVYELDPDSHSYVVDCAAKNFTMTFHGLDRGKTELAIANVTEVSSTNFTTPSPTTITSSSPTTSSNTTLMSTSSAKSFSPKKDVVIWESR